MSEYTPFMDTLWKHVHKADISWRGVGNDLARPEFIPPFFGGRLGCSPRCCPMINHLGNTKPGVYPPSFLTADLDGGLAGPPNAKATDVEGLYPLTVMGVTFFPRKKVTKEILSKSERTFGRFPTGPKISVRWSNVES